jgi:hypothetical protein
MVMKRDARFMRRREFLSGSVASASLAMLTRQSRGNEANSDLAGSLGIISASASAQMGGRAKGRRFDLLELPRILHDELDMTVIDLNTMSFPSFASVTPAYLDKLRSAANDAGCVLSNLKLNQKGFDMNSSDKEIRRQAINEYKRSIDIAATLGCRWARPLPASVKPDLQIHVASYQELCDYAADRNVQMLVENFGWMQSDPNSVVDLVARIGRNVAAGPDTGNWNSSAIRYAGLKKTFPIAVTCDFKVKQMGADGSHAAYDIQRCFQIAWAAGFRGPWCFEHGNADTNDLFRELAWLRDRLRSWIRAAENQEQKDSR